MNPLARIVIACLLLSCVTVSTAISADGDASELNVYPFVQYFSWKEFGDQGERLLKESGPQYGAGAYARVNLLALGGGWLTFSDRLELSGGKVDYAGHLQDGTPHETTVGYLGAMNRLDLGWALPIYGVTVEPFGGVGYRWWQRSINGSGGYTEQWSSLYGLFGARAESSPYKRLADARFSWSAAAKYPFLNRNKVDYPGTGEVDLEPGSEWSAVADFGFSFRHLHAAIFYENFVFPRSPAVKGLLQPRSEAEIYGLRVGWLY